MTSYSGVGFKSFVDGLKKGLNDRIEQFYEEILEEYKNDPEAISSKSREEWMKVYSDWSDHKILRKLAENYLLGDEKET